jgi:hypothetical protein
MKKYQKILAYLLGVLTFTVIAWKTTENILQIGDGSNATNKQIVFNTTGVNATNPKIFANVTSGKIQFTHDGTNTFDLGSGSGGGSGIELNTNPGFESGTTGYTASGGAFTATTTASKVGREGQSGSFDASASAQTLSQNLVTVPHELEGKACLVEGFYRYDTGIGSNANGDYKLYVKDGSANKILADQSLNLTPAGSYVKFSFGFVCPTGQVQLVFESTAATAGEILLDDLHVGSDSRRGVLGDQGTLMANINTFCTGNWSSNTATGSFVAFGTAAGCTSATDITTNLQGGAISSPSGTAAPVYTVTNLPVGRYRVAFTMPLVCSGNATTTVGITDSTCSNTNVANSPTGMICGSGNEDYSFTFYRDFEYTSAQASLTFQPCTLMSSGNTVVTLGNSTRQAHVEITRFPSKSPSDTVTLETTGFYVDANIGGANPALGSTSINDYGLTTAEITDAGLDIVKNGNTANVAIACDGGNDNTIGTLTCPVGNEVLGFHVNLPYAGRFEVCFDFSHSFNGNTNTVEDIFEVIETANNATAIVKEGGSRVSSGVSLVSALNDSIEHPLHVCGQFDETTTGKHTFRLKREQFTTGALSSNIILADRNGTEGQRDVHITMYPMTQQFPQAIALTDIDPTKIASAAAATKMGLKTYLCTTAACNNVGDAAIGTITGPAGFALQRSALTPYQKFDGSWWIKVMNKYTITSGTTADITIPGISAQTDQACSGVNLSVSTGTAGATIQTTSGTIVNRATTAGTNFSSYCDVELASKPTWAN